MCVSEDDEDDEKKRRESLVFIPAENNNDAEDETKDTGIFHILNFTNAEWKRMILIDQCRRLAFQQCHVHE